MRGVVRVAVAAALVLSAVSAARAQEPVKIGLIDMYSGPFAFQAAQIRTGFQIALDEANAAGGTKGRKFEMQSADMGVSVEKAITEGRRMIFNDNLHYVTVGSHAGAALALAQLIKGRDDVFLLGGIATSKHFTADVGGPMIGRSNLSTLEQGRALAERVKDMPEVKRIATVAPDFEFGHDLIEDFLAAIKVVRPDVTVVRQEWPKMGTADFTPQVTALQSSRIDMVMSGLISGDIISFLKTAKGFGLFDGKTRFANSGIDLAKVSAFKDGMPEGTLNTAWYPYYAIHNPEADAFNAEVQKRTGTYPIGATLVGYVAGKMLTSAIQKGGDPDHAKAASQAMDGLTFSSPVGPVKVRGCDNVATYNYYSGFIKRDPSLPDGIGLTDVKPFDPGKYERSCEEVLKLRKS
jgi:branched-chain amino acid transport system substrate-binding protein